MFEWPIRKTPFSPSFDESPQNKLDDEILSLSIRKAEKFVFDSKNKTGKFTAEQIATIRILLHHIRYGSRTQYLATDNILQYFAVNPALKVTKKGFGRCVIGRMRDSGVLVASNTHGYKLVANVHDLRQFVEYFHHFLHPMLDRLAHYRQIIRLATKNELDILQGKQYEYLRKYYNAIGYD